MATHAWLGNARSRLGHLYRRFVPYPSPDKHTGELAFWMREYAREGGRFENSWYQEIMLAIAGEKDDSFVAGKVVADFGCGPRGTLEWARAAKERIGIDVLAEAYQASFDLSAHQMRYVKNSESTIPLPSDYVDVLLTVNAIDHVDHLDRMCNELLRILKAGGEFIGSFNLHEPPTPCEPQTLDENLVKRQLLNHLEIKSYRVAPKGPPERRYAHFWDGKKPKAGEEAFLWVRATKPR